MAYRDVVRWVQEELPLGVILQEGLVLEDELFEVDRFDELWFRLKRNRIGGSAKKSGATNFDVIFIEVGVGRDKRQ